jgi:hypothetical protein
MPWVPAIRRETFQLWAERAAHVIESPDLIVVHRNGIRKTAVSAKGGTGNDDLEFMVVLA